MPPAFGNHPRPFNTRPPWEKVPLCSSCSQELQGQIELSRGVCSRLPCLGPYLQQQQAEREKARRQARTQQVAQARAALEQSPEHKAFVRSLDIVLVVPSSDREAGPLEPQRVEAFKEHLAECFQKAQALMDDQETRENYQHFYDDTRQTRGGDIVDNACGTCRGWCCVAGENRAMIREEFLLWRRLNEPDTTPEQMTEEYLSHVPETSMLGSCLFHGERGCTLPRRIRAPICNTFLCNSFTDVWERLDEDPSPPTVAVAASPDQFTRVGVSDGKAGRQEKPMHSPNVKPESEGGGPAGIPTLMGQMTS